MTEQIWFEEVGSNAFQERVLAAGFAELETRKPVVENKRRDFLWWMAVPSLAAAAATALWFRSNRQEQDTPDTAIATQEALPMEFLELGDDVELLAELDALEDFDTLLDLSDEEFNS